MAERSDQSSIQDGSDADIAFTCTPCNELGSREEAVKYCPECDEYLCTTCTKYHLKMKATRDHKLADREEGKHESNAAKATARIKCQQHPDRDIEMYCGTHDMVYCLMCIATEHRTCSDVTNLTDAAGLKFQQNEIMRMQEESKSIKELLEDTEKKKQENVTLIEEKRNKIQIRIQEIEESMIKHIKSLSKQASGNLNDSYSKIRAELDSDIAMVNNRISEVEKVKEQLQSTTEENPEYLFVQIKICQQIINDAKNVHAKLKLGGQTSIDFAENTKVSGLFQEVESFGRINEACKNLKRGIMQQKEIKVRLQNDEKTCRIIDMCQTDSGECILADRYNRKLKLMDIDQNITEFFDLGVPLTGICKTGNKALAVKLDSNRIELLSLSTRISRVRSIFLKRGGGYIGIACADEKFYVSAGEEIVLYDTKGTLIRSIAGKDTTGQTMFKSAPRQMTVYKKSVYLADYSDGIVCLASDGTKKTEFRDRNLTKTVGVCISCDGTVYAVDELSKQIVMFSQDGKCLGELVPEVPHGKVPESLCYDSTNNCLLLGYTLSDTVTVLYLNH